MGGSGRTVEGIVEDEFFVDMGELFVFLEKVRGVVLLEAGGARCLHFDEAGEDRGNEGLPLIGDLKGVGEDGRLRWELLQKLAEGRLGLFFGVFDGGAVVIEGYLIFLKRHKNDEYD